MIGHRNHDGFKTALLLVLIIFLLLVGLLVPLAQFLLLPLLLLFVLLLLLLDALGKDRTFAIACAAPPWKSRRQPLITSIWVFPKIRHTFLGVGVRDIVSWGLYWGHLILGNYHIPFSMISKLWASEIRGPFLPVHGGHLFLKTPKCPKLKPETHWTPRNLELS